MKFLKIQAALVLFMAVAMLPFFGTLLTSPETSPFPWLTVEPVKNGFVGTLVGIGIILAVSGIAMICWAVDGDTKG